MFRNLFVSNFPDSWTENTINEVFGPLGSVTSTAMRGDRKGRKIAFVSYGAHAGAKEAVEALHMKEVRTPEGFVGKLYVQRVLSKKDRRAALRENFTSSSGVGTEQRGANLNAECLEEAL